MAKKQKNTPQHVGMLILYYVNSHGTGSDDPFVLTSKEGPHLPTWFGVHHGRNKVTEVLENFRTGLTFDDVKYRCLFQEDHNMWIKIACVILKDRKPYFKSSEWQLQPLFGSGLSLTKFELGLVETMWYFQSWKNTNVHTYSMLP